jgi:hypothetical protein
LNTIEALQTEFDADILILRRAGGPEHPYYGFHWEAVSDIHDLSNYDLLIFNPVYNGLDWVNDLSRPSASARFNGTEFNGLWSADYMLRLRKFRGTPLNLASYTAFFHIFIMNYNFFYSSFSAAATEPWRHFIHFYPGGGFIWNNDTQPYNFGVSPAAKLVSTQSFTTAYLLRALPNNAVIQAYGGPFLRRNAQRVARKRHAVGQTLSVCFTALGPISEKGADHYVAIAEAFHRTFPHDAISFTGVGNVPSSPAVTLLPAMSQLKLDALYRDKIDVIFNLDRTANVHGWPLGLEAVLHGALLFSTDEQNNNQHNGFFFHEGFVQVRESNISHTVQALHAYVEDRALLQAHSEIIQSRFFSLFGYEK